MSFRRNTHRLSAGELTVAKRARRGVDASSVGRTAAPMAEVLLCSTMERIGVRELRQHASRYLARVATGETIEVTDRGRSVALLVPIHQDWWQNLVASGQVIPAALEGDLLDEAPGDYGIDASAQLAAMREDER
jgi:prevent-host-death family protein